MKCTRCGKSIGPHDGNLGAQTKDGPVCLKCWR